MVIGAVLSLGAIYAFIPIVIIIILIAAAVGLTKGTDIFAALGIGALIGVGGGVGGGVGKGLGQGPKIPKSMQKEGKAMGKQFGKGIKGLSSKGTSVAKGVMSKSAANKEILAAGASGIGIAAGLTYAQAASKNGSGTSAMPNGPVKSRGTVRLSTMSSDELRTELGSTRDSLKRAKDTPKPGILGGSLSFNSSTGSFESKYPSHSISFSKGAEAKVETAPQVKIPVPFAKTFNGVRAWARAYRSTEVISSRGLSRGSVTHMALERRQARIENHMSKRSKARNAEIAAMAGAAGAVRTKDADFKAERSAYMKWAEAQRKGGKANPESITYANFVNSPDKGEYYHTGSSVQSAKGYASSFASSPGASTKRWLSRQNIKAQNRKADYDRKAKATGGVYRQYREEGRLTKAEKAHDRAARLRARASRTRLKRGKALMGKADTADKEASEQEIKTLRQRRDRLLEVAALEPDQGKAHKHREAAKELHAKIREESERYGKIMDSQLDKMREERDRLMKAATETENLGKARRLRKRAIRLNFTIRSMEKDRVD